MIWVVLLILKGLPKELNIILINKNWIPASGLVEKAHSDGWSMGQRLIFASQHGQTSLTVAPLVVNLDFFNSPFRRNDKVRYSATNRIEIRRDL